MSGPGHQRAAGDGATSERATLRRLVEQLAPDRIRGGVMPFEVRAQLDFMRSVEADAVGAADGGFVLALDGYAQILGLGAWPRPTNPVTMLRTLARLEGSAEEVHASLLASIDDAALAVTMSQGPTRPQRSQPVDESATTAAAAEDGSRPRI